MAWVLISIAAAAFQTLRFMLQKLLSDSTLSAGGATLARFLYSMPFVVAAAAVYIRMGGQGMPPLGDAFMPFALTGALMQVLGTWCIVALFGRRNFAVGITFKKTETMQAVLVGYVILGDKVSLGGLTAILMGLIGILILSDIKGQAGQGEVRGLARFMTKSAGLGLLSGALFAMSAVGYRGATLEVGSADPLVRSLISLAVVTTSQAIGMTLWLLWREPGQMTRVLGSWRTSVWMGLMGLGGSLGWFTAFTLMNAAYVFAVGQVEVIFSILASVLFFKERITRREGAGIALISASVLSLVLLL